MTYKKGDEKGYFTKVIASLAAIAIIVSIFAYAIGGNNSALKKEVEVGNQNGAVTVDPSGESDFPTSPPAVPIQ